MSFGDNTSRGIDKSMEMNEKNLNFQNCEFSLQNDTFREKTDRAIDSNITDRAQRLNIILSSSHFFRGKWELFFRSRPTS